MNPTEALARLMDKSAYVPPQAPRFSGVGATAATTVTGTVGQPFLGAGSDSPAGPTEKPRTRQVS